MKRNWGTQQLFCLSTQQQPLFPEEGLGEQSPFCWERNEVWDHLRNPNMHKSLGSNKVHPRFLRKLADALAKSLSMIFPKSWQSGEVPDVWKKGNIAPILRKGWKEEPGSHHPGSLTSVPGKFLEQMLLEAVLRTWRTGRWCRTASTASAVTAGWGSAAVPLSCSGVTAPAQLSTEKIWPCWSGESHRNNQRADFLPRDKWRTLIWSDTLNAHKVPFRERLILHELNFCAWIVYEMFLQSFSNGSTGMQN